MKLTSLIMSNDEPTVKRILILVGIAWLPLVLLTLFEGTLYTTEITIPFLKDVEAYVRGLIVIPRSTGAVAGATRNLCFPAGQIPSQEFRSWMARKPRFLSSAALPPPLEMTMTRLQSVQAA